MYKIELQIPVYSPRWGRNDTYEIRATREALSIDNGSHKDAACKVVDGNLEWSGHLAHIGYNPLQAIFENDQIYPPTVFVSMLANAWQKWRDGSITDKQLSEELPKLFDWLNELTQIKPDDFWRECQ